ncbi:MAG: adenylate/guanylate cyclase domain-containing protein [Leptospiraceae bacterium]|nr:adenylate/guanylate cyclase domain-containing protein [Leptospiraceae bacterium]
MSDSLIQKIIRERELRNEKKVAIARLCIILLGFSTDILAYLGLVGYSTLQPSRFTIVIDFIFFSFSLFLVIFLYRNNYFPFLKYLTISFDYFIAGVFLVFDSTLPREGLLLLWTAQNGALFMFIINLLRFSKAGTIYSGILAILLLGSVALLNPNSVSQEFFLFFMNMVLILIVGYLITQSNLSMLVEANTKQIMERYLPEQLVNSLYGKNANIEPGGKKQEVTILFSDLRSFTSISETLPAEEVVHLLNLYLTEMTKVIFSNNGTIDKFIGDAIMTIFGAPIETKDNPRRAVINAIEMQKALDKFNSESSANKLKMGIGIHTGEVIVGNIGSEKRLDYTVIGDNVNICSRIEGLTKIYDCSILISEATYNLLEHKQDEKLFQVREIDTVQVKGKLRSIKIFEVLY